MARKTLSFLIMASAVGALSYNFTKKAMAQSNQGNDVVQNLDIQRYMGDWYDIAHLPQRFQKGMVGVMAHYKYDADKNEVEVTNTGIKGGFDGKVSKIVGHARIVDSITNAKLKITFFWPFTGDYWVLDVADDYSWALVGNGGRKDFWILSRTAKMSDNTKKLLLDKARARGYDVSKLIYTPQR
ncbi:MAG: lipocalin family protein [Bacteroidota bacterium]|nr:lipocalin family protein [Bacteroidota bacterium]